MTFYTKAIQTSLDVTGYREWTFTGGGNAYRTVHNQPNGKPILYFPGSDGSFFDSNFRTMMHQMIEARGIDPRYYVNLAAATLYSRGWDALTFLAELHKTRQLVASAFGRLKRLFTEFDDYMSALRRRGFRDHASAVLQQWLEARYGWRLLIYDMQDIAKVIQEMDEERRTRNKKRTGITDNYTDDLSRLIDTAICVYDLADFREVELGVRGRVIADFEPARVSINALITAWEIVPYSFVIDWFLNIGKALETLSFLYCTDRYTAAYGVELNVTRTSVLDTFAYKSGYSGIQTQTVDQTWQLYYRKPVLVSPIPSFKNRLDVPKVIDLLGLADGLFRGILQKWSIR